MQRRSWYRRTGRCVRNLVALAAHGIFRADFDFREFLAGLLEAQIEMLGQPFYVAFGELYEGIGTAIAGALRTIVHDATLEVRACHSRIRGDPVNLMLGKVFRARPYNSEQFGNQS